MIGLSALSVRDFRNLARIDLALPAEGIAVVGENGHGKTNLLEAIYYLELLRSARGARDADLVRFGAPGFHVSAEGTLPRARRVAAGFEGRGRRKKIALDGVEATRLADALGAVPAVLVSPRDVALVSGSPSERRRFLDIALALTSRPYLLALQHYRAALARRNAALRDAQRTRGDASAAAVWEPALATHGAVLWAERARWAERVGPEFTRLTAAIGERGEGRLAHEPASPFSRPDADRSRQALLAALEAQRGHDLRRGLTQAGPHRDDLALTLDGRDLRLFGSAGQQRTAALALRLIEAAGLRETHGGPPLLLLDDPFAELDARRSKRILGLLGEEGVGQVVLVVPREEDVPGEFTRLERWRIREGVMEG